MRELTEKEIEAVGAYPFGGASNPATRARD
jgi:hypothetical protein